MITRSGWVVLIGSVLTMLVAWLLGLPELHILGVAGASLVVVAVVLVHRRPSLEVERRLAPERVHVGSVSRVEVGLRNVGRRSSPVLSLMEPVEGTVGARISVAPLRPGDSAGATYQLPTRRRGLVSVGPLVCTRNDPFGLARTSRTVADRTHLTVLPAIEPLGGLPPSGGLQDPSAGTPRPVAGSRGTGELSTLRPYVPGDDLRRVHWPSSARAGDLLVRLDDPPWQGHVTILLDPAGSRIDEARFEVAVSAAASIIDAAATTGDRVRLMTGGDVDTGLVDARSARDLLLEHLVVVERSHDDRLPDPSTDRHRHSGGLVVLAGRLGTPEHAHLAALARTFSPVHAFAFHPSSPPASPEVVLIEVPAGASFATVWPGP